MDSYNIDLSAENDEREIFLDVTENGENLDINTELYTPVGVTSVNGKKGKVILTTSDIENTSDYQNGSEVRAKIAQAVETHNEDSNAHPAIRNTINTKQDKLVSGTTIKTVNGESLLGSGNIEIEVPEEYYDASWVITQSYATEKQYNELLAAINANKQIIVESGNEHYHVQQNMGDETFIRLGLTVSDVTSYNSDNYAEIIGFVIYIDASDYSISFSSGYTDGATITRNIDNLTTTVNNAISDVATNYYTKTSDNTFGGLFMPSTEHMTPIKTIEYDTASTTFYKLCTYANNSNSIADIYGEALFRVTVTNEAGTINHKFEIFISMKNAVNTYPYIMMRNYPGTTSASTTGVRYIRNLYPRALNNGGNWDMEFQTYNAAARHFKIEVFQADPKFTFYETLTATTIDSDLQNGGSTQLYTTDGFWTLGSNINVTVNSATSANYISSYLNKFISGTLPSAGQAILAQQMIFLSTDNKFYPSTETTKPIDPNTGVQLCSNAVNANAAVPASGLRQKYNNATLTNIPHATLTAGDRCFFRCTMDGSGNILSDNYVDTAMAPGYTWYYIGNATSASAINHDTTQSMFYTLDANGKLTHINGLPIAT